MVAAGLPSLPPHPPGTNRDLQPVGKAVPQPEAEGAEEELAPEGPAALEGLQEGLGAALEGLEALVAVGHRAALKPHQRAPQGLLEPFQEEACPEDPCLEASQAASPRSGRRSS
jgi:hypothetical protein